MYCLLNTRLEFGQSKSRYYFSQVNFFSQIYTGCPNKDAAISSLFQSGLFRKHTFVVTVKTLNKIPKIWSPTFQTTFQKAYKTFNLVLMQIMPLSIIKNKDDIKVVSQFPCLLGHRLYIFCHSLMQSYFINNLVIQQQKIPWFKIFFCFT